jgi:hypothetical protein
MSRLTPDFGELDLQLLPEGTGVLLECGEADVFGVIFDPPKRFLPDKLALSSSANFLFWLLEKNPGELWKLTLPECREQYVGPIGELGPLRYVQVSVDGKQIAYLKNKTTLKLTLIEKPFE